MAVFACAGLVALAMSATFSVSGQENKPARLASKSGGKPARQRQPVHRNIYKQKVVTARPLRMFYYSDDTRGYESLESHGTGITILAPQCIAVNGDGTIHGSIPGRAVEVAKTAQMPIMPLIFNQGFDRGTVSALLHSKLAQERVVRSMAELANRGDVVGFQIDFENMAPADHHLVMRAGRLYTTQDPPVVAQRPSGTVLFQSLARETASGTIGILLTGMGTDGAEGLLELRQAGSYTLAEDASTAVVYGMPGEAERLGAACEMLPLDAMAGRVMELVGKVAV